MSVRNRILGPPVPKMPSGLIELMDGLARDVLKNNPENIYEFCAHHMQTLLEIRDGRALKPFITLKQRVEKAQKKVKQRAEERRREYDKKIAEDITKQVLPPDVPCCDDSEYSEKKETDKFVDYDQPDEKAEIKLVEAQVLEKPVSLSSELKNETNDEVLEKSVTLSGEVKNKTNDGVLEKSIALSGELKNETNDEVLEKSITLSGELKNETNDELPEKSVALSSELKNEANDDVLEKSVALSSELKNEANDDVLEKSVALSSELKNEANDDVLEKSIALSGELKNKTNDGVLEKSIALSGELKNETNDEVLEKSITLSGELKNETNDEVPEKSVALSSELKNEANDDVLEKSVALSSELKNKANDDVLEKFIALSSELKNKANVENNVLSNNDQEDLFENKVNNISNQEILTAIEVDKATPIECELDNIIKVEESNNRSENNILNQSESVVVTSTDVDKDDNGTTAHLPDDATIILENNAEIKNVLPEDNEISLHKECAETIKNDGATESHFESNIKDTEVGNQSADTGEIIVLTPVDDLQHADCTDAEHCERPINVSLTIKQPIHYGFEAIISSDTNDDLTKNQAENLSEIEKSQDNDILTVLLDSNSTDSIPTQNIEPDTVPSKELEAVENIVSELNSNNSDEPEETSEKMIDTDSIPEARDNNDKSTNINTSMDLETAAITIQKVFRSFLFKTKTASYDDPTTVDINLLTEDKEKEENELLNIKDRRPLGISRMDTVLQTVNEEKSLSLSTDDSSTLSSAATIIQAHVRGFLVRNKLNLNKTISSNSLIDSDAPSIPSLEADSDHIKSKTVLNIHIVPEGSHFVSRDESILTSMDLSLDSSPPSSVNLHPLGYDKSERRKQLKREDAIQSVSPPSNNSGKLSEEHDSVKEVLAIESNAGLKEAKLSDDHFVEADDIVKKTETKLATENVSTVGDQISDAASDEMDVITPFSDRSSRQSDNSTKLLHSGEFHDIVVPTKVTRSDTSVVRARKRTRGRCSERQRHQNQKSYRDII